MGSAGDDPTGPLFPKAHALRQRDVPTWKSQTSYGFASDGGALGKPIVCGFWRFCRRLTLRPIMRPERHAGQATIGLARQHDLSVYDAAYLELAMRLGLPLASKDEALRKVAQAVGLSVLPSS